MKFWKVNWFAIPLRKSTCTFVLLGAMWGILSEKQTWRIRLIYGGYMYLYMYLWFWQVSQTAIKHKVCVGNWSYLSKSERVLLGLSFDYCSDCMFRCQLKGIFFKNKKYSRRKKNLLFSNRKKVQLPQKMQLNWQDLFRKGRMHFRLARYSLKMH